MDPLEFDVAIDDLAITLFRSGKTVDQISGMFHEAAERLLDESDDLEQAARS